jgi:hypothetical protein
MANNYNTIKIKKWADIVEEYVAAAAITPGNLIELASTGKVQKHSGAGQSALPMFALEDEMQGNGIDDDYAADAQVQCWIPGRGDVAFAILADDESVSIGDFLQSNGAGLLKKYTADPDSSAESVTDYNSQIVGIALEAIDISDSSAAESSGEQGYDKRILIRII